METSREVKKVNQKAIALAASILASGFFILTGQETAAPTVFTVAQAEAGRATYDKTCGLCHTPSLLGRNGEAGELPALSSLSPYYQKFIGPRGFVPPLAGRSFMDRWGSKTAGQLISRFQETVDFFRLEEDRETTVNITAYIMQANGAKAGDRALTRTTDTVVSSAAMHTLK